MNKTEKLILLLIFFISLILRFLPILMFQMPLYYDSNYHIKLAQNITVTGFIPEFDPDNPLIPYTYPPFYHSIIASMSVFTGFSSWLLALFFLPFLSSLNAVTFFLLFRRFVGVLESLVGALLITFLPTIISAASQSPEVFVFFVFPLILVLALKDKWRIASLLLSLNLFWNYLAFIMFSLPFLIAFFKEKKFWKTFIPFFAVLLLVWLFVFNGVKLNAVGTISGADFVAINFSNYLPVMAFQIIVFVLPLIILSLFDLRTRTQIYWFIFSLISFFASIAFFLSGLLRPWEQPKFLSVGIVSLLVLFKKNELFNKFWVFFGLIVFFGLFLFFSVINVDFTSSFAKITLNDLRAINWLESQNVQGMILAEPAFNEGLGLYSNLGNKTLTGLPLEAFTDKFSVQGLQFLQKKDLNSSDYMFLKDSNAQFLILNFEDDAFRSPNYKFVPAFNKVYSLNYYANCFFGVIGYGGILCGDVETRVLETHSTNVQKYSE